MTATHHAQMNAALHWRAAQNLPGAPRYAIDRAWQSIVARVRAAPQDQHAAIATEAAALMRAFAELDPKHLDAITRAETMPGGYQAAFLVEAEQGWQSHPILAAYRAADLAETAEREAVLAASAKLQAAQAERDAPRLVLTSIRARGLEVATDGKNLTLPPDQAARLLPSDLDALKQQKAGVLAILAAEAAALRPVVVA